MHHLTKERQGDHVGDSTREEELAQGAEVRA